MIQVLYSPYRALVERALKKVMKDNVSPNGDDPLSKVSLDLSSNTLLDVYSECVNLPLGSERKTVIVRGAFFLEKRRGGLKLQKGDDEKPLLSYLDNPDPNIDLYLLVYNDSLDLKGPFFVCLNKAMAKVSQVNELSKEEWPPFIERHFAKLGIVLLPGASRELSKRIAGDYGRFESESEKLAAYASNGSPLSVSDIAKLVHEPLEEDAFKLSNALTKGNLKEAFSIYYDLKTLGVEEVSLIILLGGQFRFLDMVSYLSRNGQSAGSIAARLHCSLGRASFSISNLSRLSFSPKKGLQSLYLAEKRILTGEMDAPLAFSLFLAGCQK